MTENFPVAIQDEFLFSNWKYNRLGNMCISSSNDCYENGTESKRLDWQCVHDYIRNNKEQMSNDTSHEV